MKQLTQLQYQFQSRVLDPQAADVPAWVSAGGRAEPTTQINAYCYAYRARLQEVLDKDFSAVHLAIGDDNFYELADAYIQAHPSVHFSLREFGEHFAEFIAQQAAYCEQPWLSELARFEWTLCSAFDAADAPLLTEQDMAGIVPERWPRLRFVVQPSLRRLHFRWNTPEMWKVLKADNPTEIQAVPQADAYWLIWRDELITRFRSMASDEHAALDCLCAGGDFDAICSALTAFHAIEDVPLQAATYLKTWITQGLLSQVISE